MSDAPGDKDILSSVFRRRGANGRHTRLFDDLEEDERRALVERAPLSENELPIIGGLESPDRWFLLTTSKLTWRRAGATNVLSVEEIVDAIVDLAAMQSSGTTKLAMRELQITTRDGRYTIDVEPGAPFSGVWNVLKAIGAGNRSKET